LYYSYVEFESADSANEAVQKLHDKLEIDGRTLLVRLFDGDVAKRHVAQKQKQRRNKAKRGKKAKEAAQAPAKEADSSGNGDEDAKSSKTEKPKPMPPVKKRAKRKSGKK